MANGPGSARLARYARLAAWAALIALGIIGAALGAVSFPRLPRGTRRAIAEALLRAMVVGYAAVLVGSIVGGIALTLSILRARRRGERVTRRAKALLLCASSLLALAASEVVAASWSAWQHRMPALPTRFDPPDGAEHIVALGGSGALGHPFNPNTSIAQVVAMGLEQALPPRRFKADVLAWLGASLTDQHQALEKVTQRPSAVLVYSGHNEFTGRFEEERNVDFDEAPLNPALHRLYRLSLSSPLCRLIYESMSKNRLDGPPPMMSRHKLIDAPMYTPSEGADVLDNFRRRLEAIVVWSERIGAIPILVIEVGDEAGFPPNRSLLPPAATAEDRRWVESQYEEGRAAEAASDWEKAEATYREMTRRQPGFAEGHFRLARLLERAGKYPEALEHYIAARDLDGMTFRCTTTFGNAYRDVAARHPSVVLVDGPVVLRSICPHGIVDARAMEDGHHASLRGIAALGRAILSALRSRGLFGWTEGDVPIIEPAELVARMGLEDRARWAQICVWGRVFYSSSALFRFDPADHLANAERFIEAGRKIAEGTPPGECGFDRLRLDPLPSP